MNNLSIVGTSSLSVLNGQANIESLYTNTLTEETKRSYMSTIKEFFGISSLNELSIEMIQAVDPYKANEWAEKMTDKGNSPATVNKKLSALQNFYSFLCRRTIGLMTYNPFSTSEGCIRFKNAIKNYSDKRALAPEEVVALIKSIKFPKDKTSSKYKLSLRDLIVIELLVTTGMRRAELTNINIGDIKILYGRNVVEITGKGDKTRPMIISKSIKKDIDNYIISRGLTYRDSEMPLITNHTSNGEENAFVTEMTIYRIVKKYADKSGIGVDDIAPHNLRHTFCTQSISMGVDIHSVQDLMGHTNVETTRRYEHLVRTITDSPSDALSSLYEI